MKPEQFLTQTLQINPWGKSVTRILTTALNAVDPGKAVRNHLHKDKQILSIGNHKYNLNQIRRILIIGAGKAGYPMALAASKILGDHVNGGVIIIKEGYIPDISKHHVGQSSKIEFIEAGHPLPDLRGVNGTKKIIKLISELNADDLVICLISGGGSALLTSPVPGVSLNDLQQMTQILLASGATIAEINTLRKHLDQVKGGKLARLAAPAKLSSLILSDVVGDPLDVIASGPTVPDSSTFQDAYQILHQYHLFDQVPVSIRKYLERGIRGEVGENPNSKNELFRNVTNIIIGSNQQAAEAALTQSLKEGMNGLLLTTFLQGEAREVGPILAGIVRQIAKSGHPLQRPACIITGGETTVTLLGDGLGGRNMEMALSAVTEIADLQDIAMITLATDGGDGPTDAAGAVVNGETLSRAKQLGLDAQEFLARNDSYHFFEALGDLLKPGPTLTNVNDLIFLFAF